MTDCNLDALTVEELQSSVESYDREVQRFGMLPQERQLGLVSVSCLIFNGVIGSGIFIGPARVLSATGSPGASLLVWAASGIIMLCAGCSWLELGLTIPLFTINDREQGPMRVSAPRSGGEKNFIEYIYKRPRFFITCVYGIMFLLLGNISGNSVAFGMYVMIAAGRDPYSPNHQYEKPGVIGLAVLVLAVCTILYTFSRQLGIYVNNGLAFFKLVLLLTTITSGLIKGTSQSLKKTFNGVVDPDNIGNLLPINETSIAAALKTNFRGHSFSGISRTGDLGSFVDSFLMALFCFAGFEQPFYVLSEVRRPRKNLVKSVIGTLMAILALYILVNIAYLCVIPKYVYLQHPSTTSVDMASTFFHILFDSTLTSSNASRVIAGLIACSIFGNVLVMTFTAARVKQEIAREGILPFSRFFSSDVTTLWARLCHWSRLRHLNSGGLAINEPPEQAPIAAIFLHYISSLLPLAVVSWLEKPSQMYEFLIILHSYTNISIIGFLVSAGLIYLKIDSWFHTGAGRRHWDKKVAWKPYLDPLPQVIFFLASTFFMFSAFVPAKEGSPFNSKYLRYQTWGVPLVGMAALALGTVWWLGLLGVERYGGRRLTVQRIPFVVKDEDGGYIQKAELVTHEWLPSFPEYDSERISR